MAKTQAGQTLMGPEPMRQVQWLADDQTLTGLLICAALGWQDLASLTPVLPDRCHIADSKAIHLRLVHHRRHCPETSLQIHGFDRKLIDI
jgi:hypothetical protein